MAKQLSDKKSCVILGVRLVLNGVLSCVWFWAYIYYLIIAKDWHETDIISIVGLAAIVSVYAVTATQKTILGAFRMDARSVRNRANELSELLAGIEE